MKVMRIITRLNIGGPALHAILLDQGLEQEGIQSLLVTGRVGEDEGDFSYLLSDRKRQAIVIPELRREIHPVMDLICLWRLFQVMRREHPDIVHTHMAKAGTLGRLAAILARVPVRVHTFHGHVFHGYFDSLESSFFVAVERFLARCSEGLIAVSDHVRHEICHLYRIHSAERVRTIPIGLDLEPFLRRNGTGGHLRQELSLPLSTPLIGIVGRLVPIKNHLFFLEIAERLLQRRRELHFVIVGGGEEETPLRRWVRERSLSRFISFLGWRKDLPEIYADLDIAVLTSKNEGTPVSLIEAMASGKAVVATRVGGVPDVVQEGVTGYTVPIGDSALFIERIEFLLEHRDLCRQLGEAGREWVSERFSKENLLRNIRTLYEELLSEKAERAEKAKGK